jgi:hypothetical protein
MPEKKEVSNTLSNIKSMLSKSLKVGGSVSSDSGKAKDRAVIMKAQSSGDFVDPKDAAELESYKVSKQRISQEELKKRVAKAQAQQAARGNN